MDIITKIGVSLVESEKDFRQKILELENGNSLKKDGEKAQSSKGP